jgi:hypothetical protein
MVMMMYLLTILRTTEGYSEQWPQFFHRDLEDLNTFLLQSELAETSLPLDHWRPSQPSSNYQYVHLENITRITHMEYVYIHS